MKELFGHIRFDRPAPAFVERDGDSLVSWDPRAATLTLERDLLGVAPLYYRMTRDGPLFGSRPHELFPGERPVLDLDGLRACLAFALSVPGQPWADVREVPPGATMTITRDRVAVSAGDGLPQDVRDGDPDATVAEVLALLRDAVGRRTGPAALLSGGLDSGLVAALARPSHTFDVDFPGHAAHFTPDGERALPDAPFADELAAHLGTVHRRLSLTPERLLVDGLRAEVVAAYDLPPGWGDRDRSACLLYREVRQAFPAVLSGEGADEVFGGYGVFFDETALAAPDFPWVAAAYDVYGPDPAALVPDLGLGLREHLRRRCADAMRGVAKEGGDRAAHLYVTQGLAVLAARVRAISRTADLDVRLPFMDAAVVSHVHTVPWRVRVFDGREKSLLRAAGAGLLPPSILYRRKSAFPSTRDPAYDAGLRAEAGALAADPGNEVFAIAHRPWLRTLPTRFPWPARTRNTVEWILNLAAWLDLHQPVLRF